MMWLSFASVHIDCLTRLDGIGWALHGNRSDQLGALLRRMRQKKSAAISVGSCHQSLAVLKSDSCRAAHGDQPLNWPQRSHGPATGAAADGEPGSRLAGW